MTLKTTWANGEQFNASDANDVATAVNAAYVKPGTGIPATDLASAVQTSLGKADSAVQSVSSTSITDATTTGKSLLTATDASTARTTLGVAYGSTAGTVCQGNDSRLSPSSTSITDATTTGKALLTTTDASTARTTLGVAYGTTSTTVAVGNDSRITGAEQTANKGAANGYQGLDSDAAQANPTIKNYTESVVAIGTVSSSHTLALTNGTVQTATLTASTACTFTMPTATAGKSFVLMLKQAASTGNGTATFTSVKWPAGTAPTITATAGKMDILSFFCPDGTNWYGSAIQNYTA